MSKPTPLVSVLATPSPPVASDTIAPSRPPRPAPTAAAPPLSPPAVASRAIVAFRTVHAVAAPSRVTPPLRRAKRSGLVAIAMHAPPQTALATTPPTTAPPAPTAIPTNALVPPTALPSETPPRYVSTPAPRGDVFGYVQNESRFGDTFYGFDARRLLGAGPQSPYVIVHYTADTRSRVNAGSQIVSDNAAVIDLGVRAPIGKNGPFAFVEGGEGFGLRGQGSQGDLRYGIVYSGDFGNEIGAHTTLDVSAARYSRYANTIVYSELAHDFPFRGRLRWIIGAAAAVDARRAYSNNFAEAYGGVQYNARNVKLRLVTVSGAYLSRGVGVPAHSTYSSVRPMALFGFEL